MSTVSEVWANRAQELSDRQRAATEARRGWTFDFFGRSRRLHFFAGTNTSACGALAIDADAPLTVFQTMPTKQVCADCFKASVAGKTVQQDEQGRLWL